MLLAKFQTALNVASVDLQSVISATSVSSPMVNQHARIAMIIPIKWSAQHVKILHNVKNAR